MYLGFVLGTMCLFLYKACITETHFNAEIGLGSLGHRVMGRQIEECTSRRMFINLRSGIYAEI